MSTESKVKRFIFFGLATGAVFFICYFTYRMFSVSGFTFAWVLNFSLMAWYTYAISLFPLQLKAHYFETKSFEKGGNIYKYTGINFFRKLLVWTGWEKITRKENPWQTDISSLKKIEYNSRSSEFGHLIIAIIVFLTALIFTSSIDSAKWLIITNIILNIYPVMLQRYNRPRYRKILTEKLKKIKKEPI